MEDADFDEDKPRSTGSRTKVAPSVTGVPPGLSYLTQLDMIIIKQKVELAEG